MNLGEETGKYKYGVINVPRTCWGVTITTEYYTGQTTGVQMQGTIQVLRKYMLK